MKEFAKKYIRDLMPYQPGRPIEEVKRELGLKRVIKLASNESPFGPSPRVRRAITAAIREINRYPDGNCFALRKELAKQLKVKPEMLVFGSGSDDIILLALRVFAGVGDEVIMSRPSFLMYELSTKSVGARPVFVPLQDFRYDLDGIRRAVTSRTRFIFIGNPDNPAGTYVPARELKAFLQSIPKDVVVFVDEAYYEFAAANRDYPNTLSWLKQFPNLVVTRTFSKIYGLAGLRIGYGVGSGDVIDLLNRIREPFNVNSLAQIAAVTCLNDPAYYRRIVKGIEQEKQRLYKALSQMNLRFVKSATNFILIDFGRNASEVVRGLLRSGVIVRDMRAWGLTNCFRVTVGSRSENTQLIQALRKVCGMIRQKR